MLKIQPHNYYIAIGFLVILGSIALISYVGISRIQTTNEEFQHVVKHQNVQSVYATEMRDAARRRMLELWRISLTTEEFARNDSFEDFLQHGSDYLVAREKFVNTGLSEVEQDLFAKLNEATTISSTYHRKIADEFMDDTPVSTSEMLKKTLPSQKHSLDALNRIIDLQVTDMDTAFSQAALNIEHTVFTMVMITGVTILVGFVFAVTYLGHNTRLIKKIELSHNELEQVNLNLESRVKQRTLQLLKANEQLQSLAHHDTLTGLANRTLLTEQMQIILSQANREQKKVAILFLDLDGFKPVNDKYGHDFGDKILVKLAEHLASHTRGSDLVARIGGDEFVVVLTSINDITHATTFAKLLNAAIKEPMVIDGIEFSIGASIGLSMYPDHADNTNDLLKMADTAMYIAKRAGKNRYSMYEDAIEKST